MSRFVYADNAATGRLSQRAYDAMLPYLREHYGNPSSVYKIGREARRAVDFAREQVAHAIGAVAGEIIFTGSGTEADNWAIRGVCDQHSARGRHIISSAIEHHAVSHTLADLEQRGVEVTYLPADKVGRVDPKDLESAIRPDTILFTIMFANNEIGTIQPIAELAAIARKHSILFHTDAVQAVGHVPIDVSAMNIDLLSLSAHKFNGPRGVGALYVRKGIMLPSYLTGGGQERGLRAGTENVAGILGMAAALEESVTHMDSTAKTIAGLRDKLIAGLLEIPRTRLTGCPSNRLPGVASFVFECVEGEAMVLLLDNAGIAASSGSACSSGSLDPSHVLLAIGLSHEVAHGSLRLSLGVENTETDVDYILETLPGIIARLRAMSPLWEAADA